jgi:hypothetical protein
VLQKKNCHFYKTSHKSPPKEALRLFFKWNSLVLEAFYNPKHVDLCQVLRKSESFPVFYVQFFNSMISSFPVFYSRNNQDDSQGFKLRLQS